MMETNDLQATIAFYTAILGFTLCGTFGPEGETRWCTMTREGVDIMFHLPNEVTNYGQILLTGSLYIYVDGVNVLWEQIKDKVEVLYEPENFEYEMREFAIKDNNGYILNFGEEVK